MLKSSFLRVTALKVSGFVLTFVIFFYLIGVSQPQYSTNFFTTTSASLIPLASNTNNKAQWVYYPSDFATAPSGNIVRIYFRVEQTMLPVIANYTNFTIKMGQTTLSALPPGPWISAGMNTVFNANSYGAWPISGNWIQVTLQTPFYYDNTKNFIVEASHNGVTNGFSVMQAVLNTRSLYGSSGSMMANSQNFLCDFGFDISAGGTDAALEGFDNPQDSVCEGNQPIRVVLKNLGPTNLSSASISWQVNNNVPVIYNWTGNLTPNNSAIVTLGSHNFSSASQYNIRAIVSNPNNLPDLNNSNDTTVKHPIHVNFAYPVNFGSQTYHVCEGDSVQILCNFSGTSPWNLIFYDSLISKIYNGISQNSFSFFIKPTKILNYYQYQATGANGCTYSSTSPILINLHPNPIVNLGSDHTLSITSNLILDAGAGFSSYSWSTGHNTQTVNIPCTQLGTGTHAIGVIVTTSYSCNGSDTVIVNIYDDTGIKSNFVGSISTYPNPADKILYINFEKAVYKPEMVSIYDACGVLNLHRKLPDSFINQYSINIEALKSGIYFLKIHIENNVLIKKLVISH